MTSLSIQGRAANGKYSPNVCPSRMSSAFWLSLDDQHTSQSLPSRSVAFSITLSFSTGAFTSVLEFEIEPSLSDCDVLLGLLQRALLYSVDAPLNVTISLLKGKTTPA